jgi:hypothetical protein
MTKPFESIRQLLGRMLGGKSAGEDRPAREFTTLGISTPEAQPFVNGNGQLDGGMSQSEIEVQTADTQRLPQINAAFPSRNGGSSQTRVAHDQGADEFGDALLDLGDVRGAKTFAGDDQILDVFDETGPHDGFLVEAIREATAQAETATPFTDAPAEDSPAVAAPVPAFENQEWSLATETVAVEVAEPESEAEESAPESSASVFNLSSFSPEAIDAIAERVVAQLSDKVVREIAWEVVPELSELLIKQKLEGQK